MRICSVKGCDNKHIAKGYCVKHYCQYKKHGHILERTRFDRNKIEIIGDHAELIILDKDGNEKARVLVDTEDVEMVKGYKWSLDSHGYARGHKGKTDFRMHRFILGLSSNDLEVDHKNRNRLDNRRENLRECEHYLNMENTIVNSKSPYHSIYKNKNCVTKPYKVEFIRNGVTYYLGYFANIEEAAMAKMNFEKDLLNRRVSLSKIKKIDDTKKTSVQIMSQSMVR